MKKIVLTFLLPTSPPLLPRPLITSVPCPAHLQGRADVFAPPTSPLVTPTSNVRSLSCSPSRSCWYFFSSYFSCPPPLATPTSEVPSLSRPPLFLPPPFECYAHFFFYPFTGGHASFHAPLIPLSGLPFIFHHTHLFFIFPCFLCKM